MPAFCTFQTASLHTKAKAVQTTPNAIKPNRIRRHEKPRIRPLAQRVRLACAAFIFNTTEFIPIALLSDIGAGFAMSPADTGIMLTVYAWWSPSCPLPLMLATRNTERRSLLLGIFAVFAAGHVVSYFAQSFAMLLTGRVAIALTHALFRSITCRAGRAHRPQR